MNSIDNPKECFKIISLKKAKELSAKNPVSGRKYPRPGWEKFIENKDGNEIYLVNSAGRLYIQIYVKPNWDSFFRRSL